MTDDAIAKLAVHGKLGLETTIGGPSGADNQIFVARVSRGEHISTIPPGVERAGRGRPAARDSHRWPQSLPRREPSCATTCGVVRTTICEPWPPPNERAVLEMCRCRRAAVPASEPHWEGRDSFPKSITNSQFTNLTPEAWAKSQPRSARPEAA